MKVVFGKVKWKRAEYIESELYMHVVELNMYLVIVPSRKQLAIDKSTIKHSVPLAISSRCVRHTTLLERRNLPDQPMRIENLNFKPTTVTAPEKRSRLFLRTISF